QRRMDVRSMDRHRGRVGRERLVIDLAGTGAVERVAADRAQLLQVNVIDAVADLLVAGETDTHRPARQPGRLKQTLRRLHDHRHAGLVVAAEERRAIGGDYRLARELRQVRVLGWPQHLRRIAGQDDVFAVVVAVDGRLDVLARRLGRGIDVGDPGDG